MIARSCGAALAALAALVPPAAAAPVVGFVEEWTAPGPGTWQSQSNHSNPGTGGLLGAGDGYLLIDTFGAALRRLGTFSAGDEYLGDWQAAGITRLRVWLNDVGQDDALEVHCLVGQAIANVWQYDIGFVPPEHRWGEFVVDLSSDADWTRTQGAGTFAAALQNLDRLHWRHDRAPYVMHPDTITADLGIDHLVLENDLSGVAGPPAGRPVALAPPVPNPSRGPVALAFHADRAGPVRIEILDAAGRRIRSAELPAAPAGARTWMWDGQDDRGSPVAPGAYRARVVGAAGGTSRSLIRVR